MKAFFPALLTLFVSAGAMASQGESYTGSWPVTAKLPPHFANTACLTLTDNGSTGSPHSGPASGSGPMFGSTLSGTFQVVNGLIVVNIQSGSDTGEVVFLSFIARAQNGVIGKGFFNNPGYLGAAPLTFGQKGGC